MTPPADSSAFEYWINEVLEYLEDCSDVQDGSYGEQVPNRAMSLLSEAERLGLTQ